MKKKNLILAAGGAGLLLASFMPLFTVKILLSTLGMGLDQEYSGTVFDMSKGLYVIPIIGIAGLVIAFMKPNPSLGLANLIILMGILAAALSLYAGLSTKSGFNEYMGQINSMMQMYKLGSGVDMSGIVKFKTGVGIYCLVISSVVISFGGWKLRSTAIRLD